MRLIISDTSGDIWAYLEPGTPEEIAALERSVAGGHWTIGRGDAAIAGLRAQAVRLGYVPTEICEPTRQRQVIVQRGEPVLVERLRASVPPAVPIIADRRTGQRRTLSELPPRERRRTDRRRSASSVWGSLRFLIAPKRSN